MKRQLNIVLDMPEAHCGLVRDGQLIVCKFYDPSRLCGLFGGILDEKVAGGTPYPRRSVKCHEAEYRVLTALEKGEERGEEKMQRELAAALSAIDAMKQERDEARKALTDWQDRYKELARERETASLRLRDLENELRERGIDW